MEIIETGWTKPVTLFWICRILQYAQGWYDFRFSYCQTKQELVIGESVNEDDDN